MAFTLIQLRNYSMTLPRFFLDITGLQGEKFFYHDIQNPDISSPEGSLCMLYISTMYSSNEPGGWTSKNYTYYIDGDGYRINNGCVNNRITDAIDAWLEEVRAHIN